jgi:hypothetical protein
MLVVCVLASIVGCARTPQNAAEISKAHVLLTLLDGHDVYRDASLR